MNFKISSTTICNRLQTLNKVINSKNSLSILDSILFELQDNILKMTASDGDITLVSSLEVNAAEGSGKFALNATQIINGLKEISDQPVKITINDQDFKVIIKYQNGKCEFNGQSGEDYPIMKGVSEGAQTVKIENNALFNGINKSLFATADDELRPVMNGVFFDIMPDNITFVASDGHKLVRNRNYAVHGEQATSFILPKKPAKTLKDILVKDDSEVIIKLDENIAEISVENYVLSCRLIEGRYPNYNSVIPKDNPFKIRIDRQAMIGALRRVLPFASESSQLIRLHIEPNKLELTSEDVDFATSAKEQIVCDYSGQTMSIGFKGSSLQEILNNLESEQVVIELADPSRAGLIVPETQPENEDVLMLIMPMLLND